MKRNLKEAILGIEVTQFDGQKADLEELVNPRQLEEVINDWMPEVLSQEWIDEHAKVVAYDGIPDQTEVIYVDDLQNLLVPKQKLLVIPNHVAKWISEHHERFDLYPALKILENNTLSWEGVYEWYRKNTRKFVNAYLTGEYEVEKAEEEPKYYVLNNEGETMIRKDDSGVRISSGFKIDNWLDNENYKLTEREIKDYDLRFWPFAVKVEELEE